ncbi:M61 family metallopeptidase [Marinoscillum furvescens]|uniref:Putative metalloprotease with PDZ domain n=1 Tax=Marinoscillum furvescens DSM 4134 TaxID=1122208 RepID=A0A3D9L0A1_MARFU|nr:peptidase M61 [Marinoscillum furvescens]RED94614.1 putative metalloprotease with PDZ domain [Marinoscillum furvescens DSM 4134]
MRNTALALLMSLAFTMAYAQGDSYKVNIDLTATADDKVPVTVYPPASTAPAVEYHMAKIVPGTYSISDFGRFVSEFKAFDAGGNELEVEQLSTNRWKITNNDLSKITYRVDDTWDQFDGYGDNIVFEPGGTNIDGEEQVYVMNTFGFVGYIDGEKFKPYEVTVSHPENIYGATALKKEEKNATTDVYFADDFNFLADGPIMYSEPDTITRQIANAEVLVAVYSPNKALSAQEVMDNVYDLMEAQASYLGGQLPVDRYAYLIYLNDQPTLSGSMGALEHSYSSVYSLPEAGADRIGQTVRDVAAHEFFHIVTPLNIHSKEIGEFNYIEPEMSKHLWLYEGVTEYASMHVQVKYNLYGPEKFLEEIQEKLRIADKFPNVSFTEMSEQILDPEYEPMYVNVYYKGALIAMCLDLHIIKYSDGKKDLQWLMQELAKKYGKEVSFDDDELFDVIEALTYPEVREFLDTYVAGDQPLPIEEVLSWAGIEYIAERKVKEISMGNINLNINADRQIIIEGLDNANEFAVAMGYQVGDVILEINGEDFSLANAQAVIDDYKANTKPGDKIKVTVLREKKGKLKKKKLKAKAIEIEKSENHFLEFAEEPSESQYKILQSWIVAGK